ncbi:MAG TPA: hypothetical protein PLH02_01810 [Bacillota bacterium]|nr:hypothetical protein [Bacillota bacterium]HPF42473.1 hypothetical protein [Bacillota bacterium]HPJ85760.1 hypothetical protein [Bacillota bacterium]HPQ61603.1 hypothetical protein [Bacillota bacterium]HRX91484.1 hypothetical protein [Candidatus Izemoplasmatales bacterium]
MPILTIFLIVLVIVIIFSLAAVIVAIIIASKNRKKRNIIQNNLEKVYIENIVEDKDDCKLTIRDLSGKRETYPVGKKAMQSLYPGETCLIARQNGKLLLWKAQTQEKPDFFSKEKNDTNVMKVTAESPVFDLAISSNSGITASQDEVLGYMDRMLENQTEHFIGLKSDDGRYLELSGNGKDRYLEIRLIKGNRSYRMNKCLLSVAKSLVRDFYGKAELTDNPGFVIEE